jgi:GTP cyclohydrolase I
MRKERIAELEKAAVVGLNSAPVNDADEGERDRALACIRYLLEYLGEDPDREGLVETPDRVLRAWDEQFSGYREDPEKVLGRTFEEVGGYDDMVLLKDLDFDSHCEHHMIPIQGVAHIAYIPSTRFVGLSKLARVVDIFAKRLQTQETLTVQIADTIDKVLAPKGVAVLIEASHKCMVTRGTKKKQARTVTTVFRGQFSENHNLETRFLRLIENGAAF